MNLILKFENREIEKDDSNTYYNHLCYTFKSKVFDKITHVYEVYDDVGDYPMFQLGYFINDVFVIEISGDGEPIDSERLDFGGVFFEIDVYDPKFVFTLR